MKIFSAAWRGIGLAAVVVAGCQDAKPPADPPQTQQSEKKDYARKTTETDEHGNAITPGSGGTEQESKPPLKIHTGVWFETSRKSDGGDVHRYPGNGYSFSYTGPCGHPQWLQFVWKTHSYDDKPGVLADGKYDHPAVHNEDGSSPPVGTTGGKGSYVTDPAATDPDTHLDTAAKGSPYYNAEGAHSDDDKTMYDAPKPGTLEKGDTHIPTGETVVYHFSTFVVCDGKVSYHIRYTMTFVRKPDRRDFGKGELKVGDAGPGGELSASEQKEFKARFPGASAPTATQ